MSAWADHHPGKVAGCFWSKLTRAPCGRCCTARGWHHHPGRSSTS